MAKGVGIGNALLAEMPSGDRLYEFKDGRVQIDQHGETVLAIYEMDAEHRADILELCELMLGKIADGTADGRAKEWVSEWKMAALGRLPERYIR